MTETATQPSTDNADLGPRKIDPREPQVRLAALLDEGSIVPLHPADTSGVESVRGRIDGAKVIVYCTDATRQGGAMGQEGCQRVVDAIDTAIRERIPVIGMFHSGGARLREGAGSLDGIGNMFAAMVRASGRVPQISVVLGPAAGGAAYGPALTDVVIMAPEGRLFVTGPDVVKSVTGEQIDMESLGGPGTHGKKSGVVHITADSEADALARTRRVTLLFSRPGISGVQGIPDDPEVTSLMPIERQRAYNVKPLIDRLLDGPMEELQARWAPNIVIGLGRLAGRSVGVVANNPLRRGGCLDSTSAEKASRFVRLCDAFGIPLLVLVDVPGYLPGVGQEWEGVVRRGAKLLHAFAEAVVPRVTLVTRKAFGGAYIAMNSKALGATAVYAWPDADIAVMGAKAAVSILHRRKLAAAEEGEQREALHEQLAADHERESGGVQRALELGVIDDIITPAETRRRVAEALASAPAGRGAHGNIPL